MTAMPIIFFLLILKILKLLAGTNFSPLVCIEFMLVSLVLIPCHWNKIQQDLPWPLCNQISCSYLSPQIIWPMARFNPVKFSLSWNAFLFLPTWLTRRHSWFFSTIQWPSVCLLCCFCINSSTTKYLNSPGLSSRISFLNILTSHVGLFVSWLSWLCMLTVW